MMLLQSAAVLGGVPREGGNVIPQPCRSIAAWAAATATFAADPIRRVAMVEGSPTIFNEFDERRGAAGAMEALHAIVR